MFTLTEVASLIHSACEQDVLESRHGRASVEVQTRYCEFRISNFEFVLPSLSEAAPHHRPMGPVDRSPLSHPCLPVSFFRFVLTEGKHDRQPERGDL